MVENSSDEAATSEQTKIDIAVVDINEVARQIGAMDKITLSMAEFELDLKSKLAQIQDQFDEQVESKKATLDTDLNSQSQGELDSLLTQHQASMSQQTALANTQLAAHHNKLKVALMNQVRPVAYDVATEKGMSIVLTTSQIYAAGPTSDITNSVAERIKAINAAVKTVPNTDSDTRVAELPGGGEFKPSNLDR